jgi:hypothetical protein
MTVLPCLLLSAKITRGLLVKRTCCATHQRVRTGVVIRGHTAYTIQRNFLGKYVNAIPGGVKVDLPTLERLMPQANDVFVSMTTKISIYPAAPSLTGGY